MSARHLFAVLVFVLFFGACRVEPDATGNLVCYDEAGRPVSEPLHLAMWGDVEGALASNGAHLPRVNGRGWCEIDLDRARVEQ